MAYLPLWCESLLRLGGRPGRFYDRIPTDCPLCGCAARGGRLCHWCIPQLQLDAGPDQARCPICCLAVEQPGQCAECALAAPAFDRIIAAFDYAYPGDLLIHRLKVQRRFSVAPVLAGVLADAVRRATTPLPGNTILVSVPASQAAIRRRGFNPAAEVARSLAGQLRMAYRPGLLRRTQEGQKQASLSRAERMRSTQALYACTQQVGGANIAVVDDVMTTGSTLQSIARQFRLAGAASVCGLVVARTPYVHRQLTPTNNDRLGG